MLSLKIWFNLPTSSAEESDTDLTAPLSKRCNFSGQFVVLRVFPFFSILDQNDKDLIEDKLDAIAYVYKKISTKDITFEFRPDVTYYTTKKP